MSFSSYKLLKCLRIAGKQGACSRLIYLNTVDDIQEEQILRGVERETNEIDGFYLAQNPVIDMNRLLTREDVADTLRQRGMNDAGIRDGILNSRIQTLLRDEAEKREAEEVNRMNWFGKKFRSIGQTVRDVTNPLQAIGRLFNGPNATVYNSANDRDIEERMTELFGQNRNNPDVVVQFIVDEINRTNAGGLAAAAPFFGLTPPTGARLMAWMADPRTTLAELEDGLESAQQVPNREFRRSYELLVNVRAGVARERGKQISIFTFDSQRLSRFLRSMEMFNNDDYKLLTEQILQPDALKNLDKDPAVKALLAQLMFHFESGNNDMTRLRGILNRIRDALPEIKTGGEDANKTDNVKLAEKVDEQMKQLKTQANELSKHYRKAPLIQEALDNMVAARGTTTGKALDKLNTEIRQKEKERSDHLENTNSAETAYRDVTSDLMTTLLKSRKQTALPPAPPPLTRLRNIATVAALNISTPAELFRNRATTPTGSGFEQHIDTVNNTYYRELTTEIDDNYKKSITGRERITAHELLVQLKSDRLLQQGVTDPGRRALMADLAANTAISRAENVDRYRAGNTEAAETLINGWTGLGRRMWQTVAGRFFNSSVFTARYMMDHVGGLHHMKEAEEGKEATKIDYKFLKGLDPNISLADLRKKLKANGVTVDQLYGAKMHLQKILLGMELNGTKDIAEISDADGLVLENLLDHLDVYANELESLEFAADSDGKKGEELKNLWKKRRENATRRRKNVMGALVTYEKTLRKYLIHEEWGPAMDDVVKEAEEKGIKGEARAELMRKKGIPETVIPILLHALALKEAADLATGAAGWAASKMGKGASAVAGTVKDKSSSLVSAAYGKVKSGASKGADAVLSVPGKIWSGAKYVKALPGRALRKAWKTGVAPFVLAGSIIWGGVKLFHYDETNAAADKAFMEKRKDNSLIHWGAKTKKSHGEGKGDDHGKKKGGH